LKFEKCLNKKASNNQPAQMAQPYQWQMMQLIANTVAALLSFNDGGVVMGGNFCFSYFLQCKTF